MSIEKFPGDRRENATSASDPETAQSPSPDTEVNLDTEREALLRIVQQEQEASLQEALLRRIGEWLENSDGDPELEGRIRQDPLLRETIQRWADLLKGAELISEEQHSAKLQIVGMFSEGQ